MAQVLDTGVRCYSRAGIRPTGCGSRFMGACNGLAHLAIRTGAKVLGGEANSLDGSAPVATSFAGGRWPGTAGSAAAPSSRSWRTLKSLPYNCRVVITSESPDRQRVATDRLGEMEFTSQCNSLQFLVLLYSPTDSAVRWEQTSKLYVSMNLRGRHTPWLTCAGSTESMMRHAHVVGTLALPKASRNWTVHTHTRHWRSHSSCVMVPRCRRLMHDTGTPDRQPCGPGSGPAHLQHVRLVHHSPMRHERAAVRGCARARCKFMSLASAKSCCHGSAASAPCNRAPAMLQRDNCTYLDVSEKSV